MATIFFTSDTHYDHANIIKFCHRPYADVDEMNEAMVENWNAVVGPKDVVYHLGDFHLDFKNPDRAAMFLGRLNGIKHLIKGNHDEPACLNAGWETVQDVHMVKWNKRRLFLFHYPMYTWPNAHKGVWHLHGHCHGSLNAPVTTFMDVGVDTHPEYRPYAFDEIVEIMKDREYYYIDHHDKRDKSAFAV